MQNITEEDVCKYVINLLSDEKDPNCFGIERRADAYLSLIYCDNDFFRVKYSSVSRWISIRLDKDDMNENDSRFEMQKNKRQFHWKARITNIKDIDVFKSELLHACKSFCSDKYVPQERVRSSIEIPLYLIEK